MVLIHKHTYIYSVNMCFILPIKIINQLIINYKRSFHKHYFHKITGTKIFSRSEFKLRNNSLIMTGQSDCTFKTAFIFVLLKYLKMHISRVIFKTNSKHRQIIQYELLLPMRSRQKFKNIILYTNLIFI